MMTRKDYVETARILNEFIDQGSLTIGQEQAFDEMVGKFITYFEGDNPNFKGDRFWDAVYKE